MSRATRLSPPRARARPRAATGGAPPAAPAHPRADPDPRAASSLRRRPSPWHVYLLRCRDGSLYAGVTNDLAARLERHTAGKGARYTRSRLPVALVYQERAADRGAALRREAALRRLTRAEKLALVRAGRPPRRTS